MDSSRFVADTVPSDWIIGRMVVLLAVVKWRQSQPMSNASYALIHQMNCRESHVRNVRVPMAWGLLVWRTNREMS